MELADLARENALLKARLAAIEATLAETQEANRRLQDILRAAQREKFGKSSEKVEREIEQLELALEDLLIAAAESSTAPADADASEDAPAVTTTDKAERRPRHRPRVSESTPRERRELDPGTCCLDCGGELRLVGEDISEMLDLIAAQPKVLQIARLKKSCRRCEKMVQ